MFEICVNIWLNHSNASCISTVKTSSSTLIISGSGYWVIDNIQDSPNIRRGVWNMAAFLLSFQHIVFCHLCMMFSYNYTLLCRLTDWTSWEICCSFC